MAAHAGSRRQDIDSGMFVGDPDDLVHVHIVRPADFRQFVGKRNIDIAERVFHHFRHLRGTDISHYNFSFTERSIQAFDLLSDLPAVRADRPGIVLQFIHHISRYDPLRSVRQMDIPANHKTFCFHYRTHVFVNRTGRYGGLDHHRGSFRAHFHDIFHCRRHITCIYFLACLVIRRRYRHNIYVRLLIFMGETDPFPDRFLKQLIQSVFLKCGFPGDQRIHQIFIVIRADHFHSVGGEHQRGGQADISQTYYVNHMLFLVSVKFNCIMCSDPSAGQETSSTSVCSILPNSGA